MVEVRALRARAEESVSITLMCTTMRSTRTSTLERDRLCVYTGRYGGLVAASTDTID